MSVCRYFQIWHDVQWLEMNTNIKSLIKQTNKKKNDSLVNRFEERLTKNHVKVLLEVINGFLSWIQTWKSDLTRTNYNV